MPEIVVPIRNAWPDKPTYEKIVTLPYGTAVKISDENFTKTHFHKNQRSLTIECLDIYKNALERVKKIFDYPNIKNDMINYFEQDNSSSDTEETILRKKISDLIRDFSRNMKNMRDESNQSLKERETEAKKKRFFDRKSEMRNINKTRKTVEQTYNKMKAIRIDIKKTGRDKGIYSPKTISNFIKRIFEILEEAHKLFSPIIEQYGNGNNSIDGYKNIDTKKFKNMKKILESNNNKESLGWNIENFEKACKEIDRASSTVLNPKSEGRKDIKNVIKTANIRIDVFITEITKNYQIEKGLKQFLKNAKKNLMDINKEAIRLTSKLEELFPLGIREMAKTYLIICISTKLEPLYNSIQEVSMSTETYKNRVDSLVDAIGILSIAGGVAASLGIAGMVGAAFAATIGYAIIGAIQAVNTGSNLRDSEETLNKTTEWTLAQSRDNEDSANSPNPIIDTQVKVNQLLTDAELMEAKAERLKGSGGAKNELEAEKLLAEAGEKKAEAKQLSPAYVKEQISNTMEKIKELYEKSREIITELYNFEFDKKQDAMKQIESFVEMMEKEADNNKDIGVEIKAAESVIDQAKKLRISTEELEEAVTSLTKAQKEVSTKVAKVKDSLPKAIKKMIVSNYGKTYDTGNGIAEELSKNIASLDDYLSKLGELNDLYKLSKTNKYNKSTEHLKELSDFEIDRTLYETKNYISRAIKINEQLAPITTITDNLVKIGMFKKISDIYETPDLSKLLDKASKKIEKIKKTMAEKVSDTTAILEKANNNLEHNLIPNLNNIKGTFEKDSQHTALQNALDLFSTITQKLNDMNNLRDLTEFLIFEAVKTEIGEKFTKKLSNAHKLLHDSLTRANNLAEEIQKTVPEGEKMPTKKEVIIRSLSKELKILQSEWKEILKELKRSVKKYHLDYAKGLMLDHIKTIEEKNLSFAINLQILINKINDIVQVVKWSYSGEYRNRVTGKINDMLPPKAIDILQKVRKLLVAIEKDFRTRMKYDRLSVNPPYNGYPYPSEFGKKCISNEEYAKQFPTFLKDVDDLIKKLKGEVALISEENKAKHKKTAMADRYSAFKELENVFNEVEESKVKKSIKSSFSAVKNEIKAKNISGINSLVINLQEFVNRIRSTAKSNKNDKNSLNILKNLADKTNKLIIVIEEDLRYRIENKCENERMDNDKLYIKNLDETLKVADETVDELDKLLQTLEVSKEKEKEKDWEVLKIKSKNLRLSITNSLKELVEEMKKDYKQQYEKLTPILEKISNIGEGGNVKLLFESIKNIEEFVNTLYSEIKSGPNNKKFLLYLKSSAIEAKRLLFEAIAYELNYELEIEAHSTNKEIVRNKYEKDLAEFKEKSKEIGKTINKLIDKPYEPYKVRKEPEEELEAMLQEEPDEEDLRDHRGKEPDEEEVFHDLSESEHKKKNKQ